MLQTSGLSVSYGGVAALRDVDLDVGEGRLVGLIGPNGAGKTTFIDALTGFAAYRGAVTLDGRDLRGMTPHERFRLGLARTWQTTELFDDLTVGENIAVARHRLSLPNAVKEIITGSSGSGMVDGVLDLLGLRWARDAMPGDLSEGQRKLVGVARAVASQPRLLCLDEPAAGLDTHESTQLGERLRALADAGTSMLLVDHDMGLVLGVCDWLFVLEFGELIASGAPAEIRRDPRVVRAYLGLEDDEVVGKTRNAEFVVACDGTENS
ncbi:ABC transporter ATP-binding protein [Parafrankia soli]|uniref:ABC transporter ATP-binding protein n=1 Tax=Parafrankia soli TaxID=2599596 RepID=A0A1S1PXZ8_9ACTN|nr:ABC transporter ATP-binding protein [Parafrankia soli]